MMVSTARERTRKPNGFGLQRAVFLGASGFAVMGALLIVPMVIIGVALGNQGIIYSSLCFLAFLIPLYVGLRRGKDFDLFEPINLVAFAILFGSAIRSIWLLLSESSRVDFIMMGTSFDEVLDNMPLILLSVLTFTIGYAIFPMRMRIERLAFFKNYTIGRRRLWIALAIAAIVSLIGIPLMISEYGISFERGFLAASHKRMVSYVSDAGEVIQGRGFERFLAFGAVHGANLIVAATLARYIRASAWVMLVILAMLGMSLMAPFLTSSRSNIVLMLLNLCIFAYYYKRLSMRTLMIVFGTSMFALSTLGVIREANQTNNVTEDFGGIDRVIGSGNSLDFVRTSAIMDRVPLVAPFIAGDSYIVFITGPIPRALWPEKPEIGLGSYVKNVIFGNPSQGGWPSGMIAEGWINFGIFGLIFPLFLFGVLLRFIYETVRPHLGISMPITLIYAVSIFRLGFGTIGLNLSQGLLQTLTYAAPTFALLIIARASSRERLSGRALLPRG